MRKNLFAVSLVSLFLAANLASIPMNATAKPNEQVETEDRAHVPNARQTRQNPPGISRPNNAAPSRSIEVSTPNFNRTTPPVAAQQNSMGERQRSFPSHPRYSGRSESREVNINRGPSPDFQSRRNQSIPAQPAPNPSPPTPIVVDRNENNSFGSDRARRDNQHENRERNGQEYRQESRREYTRPNFGERQNQGASGHNRHQQNEQSRGNNYEWQQRSNHSPDRQSQGHENYSRYREHSSNSSRSYSNRARSNWHFGPTYNWHFSNNGWQSYNQPRYSGSYNYYNNRFDFRSHAGRHFMGPYGNWSRWNNNWGDANFWARRWGFERYDPYRGWYRNNIWYSHPSQWDGWGGWFSFFISSGIWGYSYDNYSNTQYYDYYDQYGDECMRLSFREYIQGQGAIISVVACQTNWGTWVEVPNTRQFEYWDY